MNTHDIELPQGYRDRPWDYDGDLYTEGQVRAAIEADRKRRGSLTDERIRLIWKETRARMGVGGDPVLWFARAIERAHDISAPQPAEPTRGDLPRHVAQTLADAIYKAAQKMGIANGDHSTLSVPQCLHLLDCMSQPTEPEKVPSDDEIEALVRKTASDVFGIGDEAYDQDDREFYGRFARALLARYGNNKGESNG